MAKQESHLLVHYWDTRTDGTMLCEFQAVRGIRNKQGRRLIDGVIVLDRQHRWLDRANHNPDYIQGKDIIAVQAKLGRLGMYLLGQALFTRELMRSFQPNSIRTVALCTKTDAVLEPLAEKYGVEVVCIAESEYVDCLDMPVRRGAG